MNQRLSDIWKFITYDIWRITESEVTRTKFSIYNIIKTIYLCVNRFNKDPESARDGKEDGEYGHNGEQGAVDRTQPGQ